MSMEADFYLKMLGVFLLSGIIFKYMMILQKRKEEEAERKFQQTIQLIEMRNKTYEPKEKQ